MTTAKIAYVAMAVAAAAFGDARAERFHSPSPNLHRVAVHRQVRNVNHEVQHPVGEDRHSDERLVFQPAPVRRR